MDRTWAALLNCIDAGGRLGWVQPIGFAPGAYDATAWQEYGSGAFLAQQDKLFRIESPPAA